MVKPFKYLLKNPKAKLLEGRQNTFQYLEENVSESDDIWIHTSLGEFEQASFIIQILKRIYSI